MDEIAFNFNALNEKLNNFNDSMKNSIIDIFYADSLGKGFPEKTDLIMNVYTMLKNQNGNPRQLYDLVMGVKK